MREKKWQAKHILGIKHLNKDEMDIVFDLAAKFKEIGKRDVKKTPALRGKTVVNLFFENSTRTRTSFELAAKRLSADVLNFSSSASSLSKGESVVDTVKTLDSYNPDILVVRIGESASLEILTKHTKARILNAGDGQNEHPTQAFLDMFTVKEEKKKLQGLNVLIVGDIMHSRVARSNILGFKKYKANVRVCGPTTLIPYEFEKMGVEIFHDLEKAAEGADVIIMLRIQRERQNSSFFPTTREYVNRFAMTEERLKKAKKDCMLLHPGPINWDMEISSSLKEKVHPLILKQVENGLAVRMATLYLIGTQGKDL